AEAQWRAATAQEPAFLTAWLDLARLWAGQERWPELETVLGRLEGGPALAEEVLPLRARWFLARREFEAARRYLDEAIGRAPRAVHLRALRSHTFLQEGRDWAAAAAALREVLALDPGHQEAQHNLLVLYQQHPEL